MQMMQARRNVGKVKGEREGGASAACGLQLFRVDVSGKS